MDTMWMAPALSDFTSKAWGDLTDAEKRGIAAHFAYAKSLPPESFGDLSLPHHRASDGAAVFRGVAAAVGRLSQASIPSGDMAAVKAHLRAHYQQFGQDVPETLRSEEDGLTARPYPNEHACRLADPATFDRFRRESRQHEGKSYGVIYARPKGGGAWQEQAYRYPTSDWTAAQARTHCSGHQGSFEAASSRAAEEPAGSLMMPTLYLRADVQPESVNAEARTVEAVFSTGAPVRRGGFFSEPYIETLSLKPGHVRLDRLNAGAPVLNAHSSRDLADIIGVVVPGSATIRDGQGVAALRFSRRADVEPIWQDVRDGVVRNISVGYMVHKYEQTEATGASPMKRHAVDWEPYEISAVPMPADAAAQIRAGEASMTNPCVLITHTEGESTPMNEDLVRANDSITGTANSGTVLDPDETVVRTEPDLAADRERDRINGILSACEAARLPMSFARKLIDDKIPLVDAQGKVLETLRVGGGDERGPKRGPSGVRIVGADPLENVWRGIGGALLHRINPATFKLDDNSRQYRTHSLIRTMEECLEQRGVRTRGLSHSEIVKSALEFRSGLHGTSDFANIFADVANKSLMTAYQAAPQTFEPITRRTGVRDFKPINRVQLGEAPNLEQVLEHGEFTSGTIAEGKEQYALATYGRIFGMTRQGLINDDLDAFGRLITMFAQAARNKESDLVWAQILANGAMADTVALFETSTHGNLASASAAISVESLGIGRAALRKQTGLDGRTYLNLSARYLIVPPGKETIADQYTTAITPAQGSTVNPFAGRLTVISEPRLEGGIVLGATTISGSATAWYLAASLDQAIDMIEYAYLEGEEGPQVETRAGFEIDGVQTKCRLDFAAKVLDYRGLFKNSGA